MRESLSPARYGAAFLTGCRSGGLSPVYEERIYRHTIKDQDLVSFTVRVRETDLFIRAEHDLSAEALAAIEDCRRPLEQYILNNPLFLCSLEPVIVADDAPGIVKLMAWAGRQAGVGPMAAVAGALAEAVGTRLLHYSGEIIVENGGDIYIRSGRKRLVGIFAAQSCFSGKLALEILPEMMPAGICTSSGTVGPSLSLGLADAAVIVAHSAALSDAAATAVGNIVRTEDDIQTALEFGKKIEGVLGIVIIKGDRMGIWGDIKLTRI